MSLKTENEALKKENDRLKREVAKLQDELRRFHSPASVTKTLTRKDLKNPHK